MKPVFNQSERDSRVFAMEEVIKQLRNNDLNEGHCFMIFDDELPDGQAYYEYPDGHINIEELDNNNIDIPRLIIKTLTENEIIVLKEKHEVFH